MEMSARHTKEGLRCNPQPPALGYGYCAIAQGMTMRSGFKGESWLHGAVVHPGTGWPEVSIQRSHDHRCARVHAFGDGSERSVAVEQLKDKSRGDQP